MIKNNIVLIGLQAREDSYRLPNKVLMEIEDGVTVLDVIIESVKKAQNFINRKNSYKTLVKSALLIDKKSTAIFERYKDKIEIHKGDTDDVLSRYVEACNYHHADYIVRVTGDCIELPSWVISRAIKSAIRNEADFVSNTIIRTNIEGQDVEVISKKLLDYLNKNSSSKEEREHVTLLLKNENNLKDLSFKFKLVHLLEKTYLAGIKTSIDTKEEFVEAKKRRDKLKEAKNKASFFGMWEI